MYHGPLLAGLVVRLPITNTLPVRDAMVSAKFARSLALLKPVKVPSLRKVVTPLVETPLKIRLKSTLLLPLKASTWAVFPAPLNTWASGLVAAMLLPPPLVTATVRAGQFTFAMLFWNVMLKSVGEIGVTSTLPRPVPADTRGSPLLLAGGTASIVFNAIWIRPANTTGSLV